MKHIYSAQARYPCALEERSQPGLSAFYPPESDRLNSSSAEKEATVGFLRRRGDAAVIPNHIFFVKADSGVIYCDGN